MNVLLSGAEGVVVAEVHNTAFNETVVTVIAFVLIVTIARIVFHQRHVSFLPESCLVMVLGLVFGLVLWGVGLTENQVLNFNEEIFFIILIPPIIFEAGYHLDNNAFFFNIKAILLYAVFGTLANTALVGLSLWGVSGTFRQEMDLVEALLFGSLISAVDPVAVLAIFESVHVNPTLHILVFGESVLNDAISIVLYRIFFSMLSIDSFGAEIPFLGIAKFFYVSLGGFITGVVFALLASLTTKYTQKLPTIESLVVFLYAVCCYLVAEIFGMSGIVAILFCGIIMSRYTQANITATSRITFTYLTKMVASTAETIIFIYLGIMTIFHCFVSDVEHKWDISLILWTWLFIEVYRLIIVLALSFLANTWRIKPVTWRDMFILWYGGLRGAIAFALAFIIEVSDLDNRDAVVTTTLVIIWFTVFVQGISIKPILTLLDIPLEKERTIGARALPKIVEYVNEAGLAIYGGHSGILGWRHMWLSLDGMLFKIFVRDTQLQKEVLVSVNRSDLQQIQKHQEMEAEYFEEEMFEDGDFSPGARRKSAKAALSSLQKKPSSGLGGSHPHLPEVLSLHVQQELMQMAGGASEEEYTEMDTFDDSSSTDDSTMVGLV